VSRSDWGGRVLRPPHGRLGLPRGSAWERYSMTNATTPRYDTIVVGAGHAGCEAALSAARMGCRVLLLAIDLDKVAAMPCSPSIGGMAKGQLVKEIDALGGEMAKVTDQTAISYKTLNTKKGPAVHSTRTQNDKNRYHVVMKSVIEHQPRLDLKQAMVEKIVVENARVVGIRDATGFAYLAETVILATGTFLGGLLHIGPTAIQAGRAGEFAAYGLAACLKTLGFTLGRMKTGTPPRLKRDSIDFSKFSRQEGISAPTPFSHATAEIRLPQVASYIGRTNAVSQAIVRNNLTQSALYSGAIKGVSARYCPSFEDKVVRFPDRDSHQVILEPEGLDTEEIYASGLGNSLPLAVQIEFVRSVAGLESAEVVRPAYAIEYDYVNPVQLSATLETKRVHGLFMAGQINGTSGYEEAAAQGLWAGINAACQVQGRPAFVLDRSQAYMGVMIDDLVVKGTREPYRMFTSRAEYRLMLREDNADLRLMAHGRDLGLIGDRTFQALQSRRRSISNEIQRLRRTVIRPDARANDYLIRNGSQPIATGVELSKLLKRTDLDYDVVRALAPSPESIGARIIQQVEIEIKYEGYIQRQQREIAKFNDLEKIHIPAGFDYDKIQGLSNELRGKLKSVGPRSLGQAARIDGMTPAAISVLMVSLRKEIRTAIDSSARKRGQLDSKGGET
jgi:tRNA uridine 5-carboxymethylaminomethyl modification enzyme